MKDYPENMIIGSDQILVCEGKLINKSNKLSEAKNNLINLRAKNIHFLALHMLLKMKNFILKKLKEAEMLFKNVSQKQIEDYLNEKKKKF